MSATLSLSTRTPSHTTDHVRGRWTKYVGRGMLYVLVTLGALVFMGPFLFAISGSLKSVA